MKSCLIRILTVGVGALLVGATALAQTVTPVTDFSAAPGNGVYSYASSTPATVMDLLQRNRRWFWCMDLAAFTRSRSASGPGC